VLHVKLPPFDLRETATMCYTSNCHPLIYVKLPHCVTRKTATLWFT